MQNKHSGNVKRIFKEVPINWRIYDLERESTVRSNTLFTHRLGNSALPVSSVPILQKPGRYSVGLKLMNQHDLSKVSGYTRCPEAPGQGSRPLQTLIWYPALQSSSKPMTVGDYVVLADKEIHFHTPDQEHNKWRRRLKSSFALSLWAVRDAKPVEQRHPFVNYAPSQSSIASENADLCEYLASHGYVILATPSLGPSTRDVTDDLSGIDTQALDISSLVCYAATLPERDSSKVAVVSFSWEGISSLFASARDPRI